MSKHRNKYPVKKILKYTGLLILVLLLLSLPLSPSINYKIGDTFFGKAPSLYNVNLAQFFFLQASYPLFGKTVPYAHYQLSRTYFIKGDLDAALLEAHKELELYPDEERTHYILGLTYGYLNQEPEAIEEFGKVIAWIPERWAPRNDKAWLEFRIGRIDDALKTMGPVTNLTDNAWVQNTYGTLLMNKGKYIQAKQAFLYAKTAAEKLTVEDWGKTYPGNDPRVYQKGLTEMRLSIESNLALLDQKMNK